MYTATRSVVVARAYFLVPDCDDDRVNHLTGELVNPRHRQAQADVYGSGTEWHGATPRKVLQPGDHAPGWYPAMTLKIVDGVRSELPWQDARDNEARKCPRVYRAGFYAVWYHLQDGSHRIAVIGGDDTSYARAGLSEAKARRLWSRLRDFVTLKTLYRLGFRSD